MICRRTLFGMASAPRLRLPKAGRGQARPTYAISRRHAAIAGETCRPRGRYRGAGRLRSPSGRPTTPMHFSTYCCCTAKVARRHAAMGDTRATTASRLLDILRRRRTCATPTPTASECDEHRKQPLRRPTAAYAAGGGRGARRLRRAGCAPFRRAASAPQSRTGHGSCRWPASRLSKRQADDFASHHAQRAAHACTTTCAGTSARFIIAASALCRRACAAAYGTLAARHIAARAGRG